MLLSLSTGGKLLGKQLSSTEATEPSLSQKTEGNWFILFSSVNCSVSTYHTRLIFSAVNNIYFAAIYMPCSGSCQPYCRFLPDDSFLKFLDVNEESKVQGS